MGASEFAVSPRKLKQYLENWVYEAVEQEDSRDEEDLVGASFSSCLSEVSAICHSDTGTVNRYL